MTAGGGVLLDDLQLGFGGVLAAEISLDVAPGEIVMLLGPSGCGKSTVLRALAGLLEPMGGRASVDGTSVTQSGGQCAMVFQEDALLPWRSARKNVEYALKLRGVPRRTWNFTAASYLEQVGLDGYEDHLPGQLSGGMRQRVQLARTLACEPTVMLMDEPFGALDAQTRLDMQSLLVSVWEARRTTILFVTHDVDEALLLADRIVLLSPRPARVEEIITIDKPRWPGAQFEKEFQRRRYEILAFLGKSAALT
jgi:NitT/TauT family transport system ATP-binding protein